MVTAEKSVVPKSRRLIIFAPNEATKPYQLAPSFISRTPIGLAICPVRTSVRPPEVGLFVIEFPKLIKLILLSSKLATAAMKLPLSLTISNPRGCGIAPPKFPRS